MQPVCLQEGSAKPCPFYPTADSCYRLPVSSLTFPCLSLLLGSAQLPRCSLDPSHTCGTYLIRVSNSPALTSWSSPCLIASCLPFFDQSPCFTSSPTSIPASGHLHLLILVPGTTCMLLSPLSGSLFRLLLLKVLSTSANTFPGYYLCPYRLSALWMSRHLPPSDTQVLVSVPG